MQDRDIFVLWKKKKKKNETLALVQSTTRVATIFQFQTSPDRRAKRGERHASRDNCFSRRISPHTNPRNHRSAIIECTSMNRARGQRARNGARETNETDIFAIRLWISAALNLLDNRRPPALRYKTVTEIRLLNVREKERERERERERENS